MEWIILVGVGAYALKQLFGNEDNNSQELPKRNDNSSRKTDDHIESDDLKHRMAEYQEYFDNLLNYPLTEDQRKSILQRNSTKLILASAGCGKTSLLIAHYAFLCNSGVDPSKILLLAFNKNVAEELRFKLEELGVKNPYVKTFHSFGRQVLFDNNKPVELAKHAEMPDTTIADNFIKSLISSDINLQNKIQQFRALCRYHSIDNLANNMEEYNELLSSFPYKNRSIHANNSKFIPLPTLDSNILVRSQEELMIANWLIINGIKFVYEEPYDIEEFSYHPDFFIPEADLWIEHFAIDSNGNSPFPGYVEQSNEKKEIHLECNSNLECTYSYNFSDNTIEQRLEEIMDKNSIKLNPLSNEEIEKLLANLEIDKFNIFLHEMIRLAKVTHSTKDLIIEESKLLKDQFRTQKFLEILFPLLDKYKESLKASNTIDYEDMITNAYFCLENEAEKNSEDTSFSHILIDEFQDVSGLRYDLVRSLIGNNLSTEIFAVGDDWQSINRFAGSDISITLDFKDYFSSKPKKDLIESESHKETLSEEKPAVYSVGTTFRCSTNIAKLASEFIAKNPHQWPKNIVSYQTKNPPIKFQEMDVYSSKNLIKVIENIPKSNIKKNVLVLFRQLRIIEEIDSRKVKQQFPHLDINFMTIHQSKGLEADHVIILGVDSGSFGFPRLFGEDPLRDIFLPRANIFEFAEERRVFYVGMTRAKENLFICSSLKKGTSRFYKEVLDIAKEQYIPYEELPIISEDNNIVRTCPECSDNGRPGKLVIKTKRPSNSGKKYNVFLGCNMYKPGKENTYLFCDYTDFQSAVPCLNCRQNKENGILSVGFSDKTPKVRLECNNCNKSLNYYDFHKKLR